MLDGDTAWTYHDHRKALATSSVLLASRIECTCCRKGFHVAARCHYNLEPKANCKLGRPNLWKDACDNLRPLHVVFETYFTANKKRNLSPEAWCMIVMLECGCHLAMVSGIRRLTLLTDDDVRSLPMYSLGSPSPCRVGNDPDMREGGAGM